MGAGMGVTNVYDGAHYQRGHGIGSFLGGIFRAALPILSKGAKAIGEETMHTGFNLMRDVAQNKPIRDSVLRRLDEAGDNLKRKAVNSIGELMKGSGYKKRRIVNRGSPVLSQTFTILSTGFMNVTLSEYRVL
ncbi:hypothetical protein J437_LFUL019351 [Ladona fulva]|uniref:Uncharacterized protein n=1 Tax=Ladona fulva TaxID=123851 RepID=A0A8K0KX23_LADFU|nr:hypothetical protein J437_LFUL019351 [Ladona fulva]